jgi:hypothetical protein
MREFLTNEQAAEIRVFVSNGGDDNRGRNAEYFGQAAEPAIGMHTDAGHGFDGTRLIGVQARIIPDDKHFQPDNFHAIQPLSQYVNARPLRKTYRR